MLDIKLVRENPNLIKENIKKKFQHDKVKIVDNLIKKDNEWRELKQQLDLLRAERNKISEGINLAKKQNDNQRAKELIKKAKDLPNKITELNEKEKILESEIKGLMFQIPNIISKKTPIGKGEANNKVIRKVGVIPKFSFPIKNHVELGESLKVLDFDSSAKTSGNGFYYLKGDLALLNQALIRFTIDYMKKKKYVYIEPPLMVNKRVEEAKGDFEAFEKALYKIENEDLFMIPTSEDSILGMLSDKTISEEDLPLKFFSYTMCFRKEIGSHGINEKGLWRTHQFNKIEQFIFCKPEDSEKYYDELLKNSEEILKALKLPYRILEMCSSELADWKYRSADLEVYRPTTKEYGELMSLSNCTDYQARKLNIKCYDKKDNKRVVHTLNNTALATSRALVVIMENYQQKDGSIKVPLVLQKYTGFKRILKQ